MNAPNTEILIKDYFLAAPADRPAQCEFVASHITSVVNVILVLDWGAYRASNTKNAYESAVDLLIKCAELLTKTPNDPELNQWQHNIRFKIMLELLIKSISLCPDIKSNEKLETILKILPRFDRYCGDEIKMSVIKSLLTLSYEVNLDDLKHHVYSFLSANFCIFKYDEPVRQYAQTVFDEVDAKLAACRKQQENQISLEQLIEKITPYNQHDEIDWEKQLIKKSGGLTKTM